MNLPLTGIANKDHLESEDSPRRGGKDETVSITQTQRFKMLLTSHGKRKRREALRSIKRDQYFITTTYDWKIDDKHMSSNVNIRFSSAYFIEFGMNLWAAVANIRFRYRPKSEKVDILISFLKGKFYISGKGFVWIRSFSFLLFTSSSSAW